MIPIDSRIEYAGFLQKRREKKKKADTARLSSLLYHPHQKIRDHEQNANDTHTYLNESIIS